MAYGFSENCNIVEAILFLANSRFRTILIFMLISMLISMLIFRGLAMLTLGGLPPTVLEVLHDQLLDATRQTKELSSKLPFQQILDCTYPFQTRKLVHQGKQFVPPIVHAANQLKIQSQPSASRPEKPFSDQLVCASIPARNLATTSHIDCLHNFKIIP